MYAELGTLHTLKYFVFVLVAVLIQFVWASCGPGLVTIEVFMKQNHVQKDYATLMQAHTTLTHTLSHTQTHSLTHRHTHPLTHTHTHTHTHSHTHTYSHHKDEQADHVFVKITPT